MTTLAEDILQAARARGLTLASAESCTGGMVAGAITDVAGSSAIFMAGIVTYSNAAKADLLGVPMALIEAHGAVSEEVARAMAAGAARVAHTDLAVSTTGIAGPGGSEFKPEGRVCFGLHGPFGTRSQTVEFGPLGRAQVRAAARDHALSLLLAAIREEVSI